MWHSSRIFFVCRTRCRLEPNQEPSLAGGEHSRTIPASDSESVAQQRVGLHENEIGCVAKAAKNFSDRSR